MKLPVIRPARVSPYAAAVPITSRLVFGRQINSFLSAGSTAWP